MSNNQGEFMGLLNLIVLVAGIILAIFLLSKIGNLFLIFLAVFGGFVTLILYIAKKLPKNKW